MANKKKKTKKRTLFAPLHTKQCNPPFRGVNKLKKNVFIGFLTLTNKY